MKRLYFWGKWLNPRGTNADKRRTNTKHNQRVSFENGAVKRGKFCCWKGELLRERKEIRIMSGW